MHLVIIIERRYSLIFNIWVIYIKGKNKALNAILNIPLQEKSQNNEFINNINNINNK
jgi:hypothetical protein